MTIRITSIVDTVVEYGFCSEFGLSMRIEAYGRNILFDTGAGQALLPNAARLGLEWNALTDIVLSHGHYDHTTGLARLHPQVPVYVGAGIRAPCWSQHDDSGHWITLPEASKAILENSDVHVVEEFTEISPGVFLTGRIPRRSGENCGGRFYTDETCSCPNTVPEEQALLLKDGILVTGCCHAGIINTLEACHLAHPEIGVRTIVGGLHLLHADEQRLRQTIEYLLTLNLDTLLLMHCTGEAATSYLREHLTCNVISGKAGRNYDF